jgi:2-keto-4-pentenoate hydratase/2-oxohepta-3-ene-1,7-dioic acid hydratase in catechol pathway
MKLISFEQLDGASGRGQFKGRRSWGLLDGQKVADLGARFPEAPTLKRALERDILSQALSSAASAAADFSLADLKLLPPIIDAEKILCVGVNYAERNEEYKDNSNAPKFPSLFMRTPDSLVAHGEPILRPLESDQLDYEGEIVMIIGKAGRRISRADAHQHIAGLTLMNEGTVRDWIRHGKFNVTQGKNFAASGAIGPWMVPTQADTDYDNLQITTKVNGELRQDDNTRRMMFPFDELIRYISQFMILKPGDVIATGTPTGAGARFDPPKWLKPGDRVEIHCSAIGSLVNPIQDDPARG